MAENKKMMHIGVRRGEIGTYVFLPGSPERAEMIAEYLTDAVQVAYNREYQSFTGLLDGTRVSVCSTGMGGPSMAIAVEELAECGAHTMIRVGTCESTAEQVKAGDIVLPNGAVRMEGVAQHYLPMEYPAVPDMPALEALEMAAKQLALPYHVGVNITKACFYTQTKAASRPFGYDLVNRWQAYEAGGALSADMSCAPLFIVAGSKGVRAAAVLAASCNYGAYSDDAKDWPEDCEKKAVEVGIEAMRLLIQRDKKAGAL